MANIFVSCSGSTGKKYDLWITVIQNTQNSSQNKSNITAKIITKIFSNKEISKANINIFPLFFDKSKHAIKAIP